MSFNATAWAWETPLRYPAKVVLLALANRADDKGECFPSLSKIADDLGLSKGSRNTVRKGIVELHRLGYIEVFAQYHGKGQQTSNRFKLNKGFIHKATAPVGGEYSTRGEHSTPPANERPVRQGDAVSTRGEHSTGVGEHSTTNQSSNHFSSTEEEVTRARGNDSWEGYDFASEVDLDDRPVGEVKSVDRPGAAVPDPNFDWDAVLGRGAA